MIIRNLQHHQQSVGSFSPSPSNSSGSPQSSVLKKENFPRIEPAVVESPSHKNSSGKEELDVTLLVMNTLLSCLENASEIPSSLKQELVVPSKEKDAKVEKIEKDSEKLKKVQEEPKTPEKKRSIQKQSFTPLSEKQAQDLDNFISSLTPLKDVKEPNRKQSSVLEVFFSIYFDLLF